MIFKFLLIDDESELTIGFCEDILILNEEKNFLENDVNLHKLVLLNFNINNDFIKYHIKLKEGISNINIGVIDRNKKVLGMYYMSLNNLIRFNQEDFDNEYSCYELEGTLINPPSNETLKLWDIWRNNVPNKIGEWRRLTNSYRFRWLEIVRLYNSQIHTKTIDKKIDDIYLDGAYIKDSSSFFCALGEAVNGPGGYFGFDINSLQDCLCGSFGIKIPFTIIWYNSSVMIKSIVESINKNQYEIEESSDENKRGFFLEVIKLLLENNIKLKILD